MTKNDNKYKRERERKSKNKHINQENIGEHVLNTELSEKNKHYQ